MLASGGLFLHFPASKYHMWQRGIEPYTGLIPQEVNEFIMAVDLSGLPCMGHFDTVGKPATQAQRWKRWEREFKLYVAAAGDTDNRRQLYSSIWQGKVSGKSLPHLVKKRGEMIVTSTKQYSS